MLDHRPSAHFAAPRSVRHLNAGVLIFAVILVERNLLVAGFQVAVVTLLESQSGKNFVQAFDSWRPCCPRWPVTAGCMIPPLACIFCRVRDAVVSVTWRVYFGEPFVAKVGKFHIQPRHPSRRSHGLRPIAATNSASLQCCRIRLAIPDLLPLSVLALQTSAHPASGSSRG